MSLCSNTTLDHSDMQKICEEFRLLLLDHIVIENDIAYTIDPLTKQNNIHCDLDICNGLKYLADSNVQSHAELIKSILNNLIEKQNVDGSWNEVHMNYNKPSTLMTSLVGLTLLNCKDYVDKNELNKILKKTSIYIKSQEYSPGYFKKSESYFADILNVDASVGAFFSEYGVEYNKPSCIRSAEIAAHNVCCHQFPDGSFPYSISIRAYPYKYHLNVPSIFYQSIVLFYLIKINKALNLDWLKCSIDNGTEWLIKSQKKNGFFKWSNSGLPFSLYLNSTYVLSLYAYLSNNDYTNVPKTLIAFKSQFDENHLWKLEKANFITLPFEIKKVLNIALKSNYPIKHKLFRIVHCFLMEIARRRHADPTNDKFTRILYKISKIESSTYLKFSNYSDFAMNCEIFHYLAASSIIYNSESIDMT